MILYVRNLNIKIIFLGWNIQVISSGDSLSKSKKLMKSVIPATETGGLNKWDYILMIIVGMTEVVTKMSGVK